MRKKYLNTKSVKYFLDISKCNNIIEAVECIAEKEREIYLLDLMGNYKIPIDVDEIARLNNIKVINCPKDKLSHSHLNSGDNYFTALIRDETKGRNRISLAHEICHSFFRDGLKHKFNTLSLDEIKAEEDICNKFSTALLMPPKQTTDYLKNLSGNNPWDILKYLENIASKFLVSVPALLSRMNDLDINGNKSLVFIQFKYFNNIYTKKDRCLRVNNCSSFGYSKNVTTWFNRSADNMGLHSAHSLFYVWQQNKEIGSGKYILKGDNDITRISRSNANWSKEVIKLSIKNNDKWIKEEREINTFSCLYYKKGWSEKEVYIISILEPAN